MEKPSWECEFRAGTENQEDFFFKQVAVVKGQRSEWWAADVTEWGEWGAMSTLSDQNGGSLR